MTDRDRKILVVVVALAALAAYWFLVLSPKRGEVSKLDADIATQEEALAAAQQQVQAAQQAQATFASDYAEIVRLGKAIPTRVDMPSLLVQLDRAARGTRIKFDKITAQERVAAAAPATAAPATPAPGVQTGDAAAGGPQAGSAPGKAAEVAAEKVDGANKASAAKDSVDPAATDTSTSKPAKDGALPVGGGNSGAGAAAAPGAGTPVPGLDAVPLSFTFRGRFFDLASFFHRLKRFVHVTQAGKVRVRGRLMTIDKLTFNDFQSGVITASITASVYLTPKTEGATAGATPQGPAPQNQPVSGGNPVPAAPPAATAQP